MSPPVACPPPAQLEEFLLGREGDFDPEDLEGHLVQCAACQSAISRMAAEDELVRALRTDVSSGVASPAEATGETPRNEADSVPGLSAPTSLVNLLVPLFKRIPAGLEATVIRGAGEGSFTDDLATRPFPVAGETSGSATDGEGWDEVGEGVFSANRRLGRFELRRILGRGGMGTVVEAWDPLLERAVAIKVPHRELLVETDAAQRLIAEARAAAALVSDHIVPIHSVEETDGVPYLVMPLLAGVTLKDRLEEQGGTLPVEEVLRIGREAASGLAVAHKAGLLHCDIKPGNLWLESPGDRVKVLDFGLALPRERDGKVALGGSGTPGYLAPEQARHEPLDPRVDVFALGCVMYRAATGNMPFTGPKRLRTLWTVLSEAPPPVCEVRPEVPLDLGYLIDQMLQQDRELRPTDGTAVLEELEWIEWNRRQVALRRTRRRWLWGAVAAALLGVGSMALWSAWFGPRGVESVLMTFDLSHELLGGVLQRDGRVIELAAGKSDTVSLEPGVYRLHPVAEHPGWLAVPAEVVVEPNQPRTVRVSLVGELASKSSHTQAATGCAFASVGDEVRVVSVGLDRRLARWSVNESGAVEWLDLPHAAKCVVVSHDGRFALTGGGNIQDGTGLELSRWDLGTLTEAGTWPGPERLTLGLAWSPDGRLVASTGKDGTMLWKGSDGTLLEMPPPSGEALQAVAWNEDGTRLAGVGAAGKLVVWTARGLTVTRTRQIVCGGGLLRAVAWVGETCVAGGEDGHLWLTRTNRDQPDAVGRVAGGVRALGVARDGRLLLVGTGAGGVEVRSTVDWTLVCMLSGHRGAVTSVAGEPGGERGVSAGEDGTVRLWRLPDTVSP
jgi:eukaryotic-like serine/threonine-protein kinase